MSIEKKSRYNHKRKVLETLVLDRRSGSWVYEESKEPPLWQKSTCNSVFKINLFDLSDYQQAQQIIDLSHTDTNFPGNPIQDSFISLFKPNPVMKENTGPLKPLADIIKLGQELPDYQRLRENTVGQKIASIYGATHFVQEVLKNLPPEVKDAASKIEKSLSDKAICEKALAEMRAYLELLPDNAENTTLAEGRIKELEAKDSLSPDLSLDKYEEIISSNKAKIKAIINSAATEAQDKAKEAQDTLNAFGLAAGSEKELDPSTAREVMEFMSENSNLKDLAEFLGWAKKMVRGEWRQAAKGSHSMTGYKIQSFNPTRLASSERMAMSGSPAQKADFSIRLTQEALVHQKFDGKEQSGRGPMILIRDESFSMSGERHSLAIALEWALIGIAKRERREFYSIPFSGQDEFHIWEMAESRGTGDPKGLLSHLRHFYGGGTEPYRPIFSAMNLVAEKNLKADILLITDENFAPPTPAFLERVEKMKKNGLKIVVVRIGNDGQNLPFADKTINVRDFILDKDKLCEAVREII